MMQSTCPFLTVVPTSTNAASPGLGRAEERADDRRLHDRKIDFVGGRRLEPAPPRGAAAPVRPAARPGRRRREPCGTAAIRRRRLHEAALLDLDLEAFALELELAQLVLAHHLENAIDLVKFHACV